MKKALRWTIVSLLCILMLYCLIVSFPSIRQSTPTGPRPVLVGRTWRDIPPVSVHAELARIQSQFPQVLMPNESQVCNWLKGGPRGSRPRDRLAVFAGSTGIMPPSTLLQSDGRSLLFTVRRHNGEGSDGTAITTILIQTNTKIAPGHRAPAP